MSEESLLSEAERDEIPFPCQFRDSERFYKLAHFLEEISHYSDSESHAIKLATDFHNYEGYSRTSGRYVVPLSASDINKIGAAIFGLRDLVGDHGRVGEHMIYSLVESFEDLELGYRDAGGIGRIKKFGGSNVSSS